MNKSVIVISMFNRNFATVDGKLSDKRNKVWAGFDVEGTTNPHLFVAKNDNVDWDLDDPDVKEFTEALKENCGPGFHFLRIGESNTDVENFVYATLPFDDLQVAELMEAFELKRKIVIN